MFHLSLVVLLLGYNALSESMETELPSLFGFDETVKRLHSLLDAHTKEKRDVSSVTRTVEPGSKTVSEEISRSTKTRFRPSKPLTKQSYDLGPIDQCSCPQLDMCSFPDGFSVPEFIARSIAQHRMSIIDTFDKLVQANSARCGAAVKEFACSTLPRCINNGTTVRYPAVVQESCLQAFSSCPQLSNSTSIHALCKSASSAQVSGDFSLTQCRVPNVTSCRNSKSTPDWLAAHFEYKANANSFPQVADSLGFQGSCRKKFLKYICTQPTCDSRGRLRGYQNKNKCRAIVTCSKDKAVRKAIADSLQCTSINDRRSASTFAGRLGPPCVASSTTLTPKQNSKLARPRPKETMSTPHSVHAPTHKQMQEDPIVRDSIAEGGSRDFDGR